MLNSPRLATISNPAVTSLILTGGLNEQVSNLELKGGKLTVVQNYVEKDGGANGYTSFQGYERYDGQTSPSSVAIVIDPDTGEVTSDVAREAARTAITAIPGSGITTGVHIYGTDVYGFRDNAGATAAEMYKATAGGWSKITSATMTAGGAVQAISSRFAVYNTNLPIMAWVDGVSDLHIYNGTTVSVITDPALPAAGTYPTLIGEWNNRLFLAYPGGHIFFSVVGDPTDFTAASGAGEIFIGDTVTGFTVTPGGDFLITMKDRIEFLTETTTVSTSFAFEKNIFSDTSGAVLGTVKRMLGTVYFADDRGVTTLEAAQEYGDFIANTLSKNVERSYQDNKANIVLSTVNRQDNQYILLFNGASVAEGLVFSFKGKYLKGATKIKLDHLVYNIAEGKDNDREDQVYFGSTDGFVFKLYTGSSFDGEEIPTLLATSFYHYKSPTIWKTFKEIMFEVTGEVYTELSYRAEYDYEELYFPSNITHTKELTGAGGVWGAAVWNAFKWGSGGLITRLKDKLLGYGTNMRMLVTSSSKYKSPHSLHNMITQYTTGSTKV